MNVTTENGIRFISKEEVYIYRGTGNSPFNCVLYLKNGDTIYIYETFEQVDSIFDF